MGDRFRRRAEIRDQALPGILADQSQAPVSLDRPVDDGIPVDLLQSRIEGVIQSEKMDQEGLINALIKKVVSFLPEGKHPARGLDDIGSHGLCVPEELSTFQCVLQ